MKIILSCPITVYDAETKKFKSQVADLKKLDGLSYSEEPLAEHIDEEPLDDIGLEGGDIRLVFDAKAKELRVVTEYASPRKLTRKEVAALIEYTSGQWSDGAGENCFTEEAGKHGLGIFMASVHTRKVHVEQIADKTKAAPRRPSPLLKAAEKGELEQVKRLLAKGEDINATNKWGQSALFVAIMNKHPEVALYLIDQGAAVDPVKKNTDGPLHAVGMVGPAEVARALLEKKADVNARDGDHGATPAMWAANRGQLDVLKLLIEHKADLNLGDENRITRDAGGQTALMYADPNRLDIVGLLLDHGASPDVRNLQGKNYLEAIEEQLELDKRPERQQAWQAVRDFLKARLEK